MTVYTHFGGMGQLITEVVRQGFTGFGRRLAEVPRGEDPVADLFALGLAYRDALANPQLYRLMFGMTASSARAAPACSPPAGRTAAADEAWSFPT